MVPPWVSRVVHWLAIISIIMGGAGPLCVAWSQGLYISLGEGNGKDYESDFKGERVTCMCHAVEPLLKTSSEMSRVTHEPF